MFKSKIFIKAMLIVLVVILTFASTLSFIILPKIETSIKTLEEKNAKKTLDKVVNKIKNVHNEIELFRNVYLEENKKKLVNLTQTIWSITQNKYSQSNIENIGILLKRRALEFEKNLLEFYYKNKNNMSEKELKNRILKFIEIYRYNKGEGYFWVNEYKTSKMLIHPTITSLNGKKLISNINSDGIIIYKKVLKALTKKNQKGVLKYKWLNPISGKKEDKISYVFLFKPFNWVIGTGEYFNVLKQRLQSEVYDLVKKVTYSTNNYFFILNYDGTFLSSPYFQGRNFLKEKDKNAKLIVESLIKIAKEKKEGFYTYLWRKNQNEVYSRKISFVKDFPNWQIVIGTGLNVDLLEKQIEKKKKELLKELRDIIKNTKIGKTGYLYILTKSGKMLIHPNKKLDNKDISKLLNPISKTYMYDELVKGYNSKEKMFYYIWNKPSDPNNYIYKKVSFVDYVPEFNWYVASSMYTEELKESSNKIGNYIFVLTIIVLFLTFIISFIFFRNLLDPLNKFTRLVQKVSSGDFSDRFKVSDKNDEISILVDKFNEMLETIEKRTNELEDSNNELETMIDNLKRTQSILVKTEKMAGLGQLVSGVAHEINTPVGIGLTASSHFVYLTETLIDKYKKEDMSEEEFNDYISEATNLSNIIFSNLTKTSNIVKNFKQVAVDLTSEKKRIFFLKEYLEGIFLSMDSLIKKKNIKIKIKCEDKLKIDSYPGLYSQIFTNLILNSIHHGFKDKEEGEITINVLEENDILNIVYIDDGKGVSEDNISKVFEPFFTTNRSDGATGLGLSIIYNIVTNNLKGTVSCDSTIGMGVVVVIELPLKEEI